MLRMLHLVAPFVAHGVPTLKVSFFQLQLQASYSMRVIGPAQFEQQTRDISGAGKETAKMKNSAAISLKCCML